MVRVMVLGKFVPLVAVALCSCSTPIGLEPTSICDFVDEGRNEDGAQARLQALYSTDGMQVAFFRDASCPQHDIRIRFEGKDSSIQDFRNQVASRAGPGNPLQRYDLDVSGTYRDRYGAIDHAFIVTKINAFQDRGTRSASADQP